jgi:hypothetical protein
MAGEGCGKKGLRSGRVFESPDVDGVDELCATRSGTIVYRYPFVEPL